MKKSYDFSKAVRNPYVKQLKKQLTIRLDTDTLEYFQGLSRELSLPYQTLMNMYLRECATTQRRPQWAASTGERSTNQRSRRMGAQTDRQKRASRAPIAEP